MLNESELQLQTEFQIVRHFVQSANHSALQKYYCTKRMSTDNNTKPVQNEIKAM